jgi:hypothetical protein
MVDGAVITSAGGAVRVQALGGDVTIGEIDAGQGSVALLASGSVLDLVADTSAVDVSAASLVVTAGAAIGASGNHLETSVDTLSATSATGGSFFTETDGVIVQVISSGADLVLVTLNGVLTVTGSPSGGVQSQGNALLHARDTAGPRDAALVLEARVSSASGSITLLSDADLNLRQSGHVDAIGAGGTVDLQAAGALVMSQGEGPSRVEAAVTAMGDVRLQAGTDIRLGSVTTAADVALIAGGSIFDGDAQDDVTAAGLLMRTGLTGGIATLDDALDVAVTTLAMNAGAAGAFILESSGLVIDNVQVDVVRMGADGTLTQLDVSGQDLSVVGGALVVRVAAGDLTVRAGTAASLGVSATGSPGSVLLESVAGAVVLDAGVQASGSVSVIAAKDILLGVVTTPADVTLVAAGSVVSGSAVTDVVADSLRIVSGPAGSIGQPSNPLETRVRELTLAAGSGGASIREADGLTVVGDGVESSGDVSIQSSAFDLTLNAHIVLSGTANLNLQATQGAVLQTAGGVSAEQGDVSITGKTGASMTRVSSASGEVGVVATDGGFNVPAGFGGIDYGDQPVRVQAVSVDIAAPLSGSGSLELTMPGQTASLLTAAGTQRVVVSALPGSPARPIVIGDTAGGGGAPSEGTAGLYIDRDELGQIVDGFERIVIGSQDPGQSIWLQAPWTGTDFEPVVFRDPLVLVASGSARDSSGQKLAAGDVFIRGDIFGEGLTVWGSGSTTYLDQALLRQADDVLISDTLIVRSDSSIEVTKLGGVIELRGSVVVRAGVTLSLSASELRLTGDPGSGLDSLTLEAGSTLVLGTARLTVGVDVVIDGGGSGALRLTGPTVGGAVTSFDLQAADLQTLADHMVDGSFGPITIGVGTAEATVRSPALWSEGADTITLHGHTVRLGSPGQASTWEIGAHTTFKSLGGDLEVHADLQSTNGAYLTFEAPEGAVRMAPGASIRTAGGVVSIMADDGIQVTEVDASWQVPGSRLAGAVALDSPSGTIRLTGVGDEGLRAQSVSMYGFGPRLGTAEAARMLAVEAQRLQVSAPRGTVFENAGAGGQPVYRVADAGAVYGQLKMVAGRAEVVLMPRAEVAGNPVATVSVAAVGALDSPGFTRFVHQAGTGQPARQSIETGSQTRAYLQRVSEEIVSGLAWARQVEQGLVLLDDDAEDDEILLSDLAYGLAEQERPSFVLGLPALQPLSSGLSAQRDWAFDFEVD